ncbi:MAG: Ig domain-containing protein, partial [Lachnospiraceae bacterium]|nr:Ig domain-containing protein [Lachnospiraceae bacterium]
MKSEGGSVNYASFPQYFDTSNSIYTSFAKSPYSAYDNGSTKREVTNSWTGYVYWHWMYNVGYAAVTNRTISDRPGDFDQYGNTPGFVYKYFSAFTSSVNCPYLDNYYCCSRNQPSYNCVNVMPDKSSLGTGTTRYFRFDYYTSSYKDSRKIYEYTKTTRKESSTEVTSSKVISNIVQYVRYRKSDVAATGIDLNKTKVTLIKGQTDTLTATIYPSNATNKTVTWTTSNSSVCTVDSGKVYAVGEGTATIVAKTNNGYTASCVYQVIDNSTVEVISLILDRNSVVLTVGGTTTLAFNILPSNASNKSVTWTSSNTSVATVSGGKITAVGEGTATITAKTSNNKTSTCLVTVSKSNIEARSVSLDKTSLALIEGGTATLKATVQPSNASDKSISWTSSNTSVALVSGGEVIAVGEGTATITATTSNGKKATCSVTVSKATVAVTGVSLNENTLPLAIGSSATLTATVAPSNATNKTLTWTSSNTSVATVTSSGKVTGVTAGTATITVKTNNGKTDTCTVTVSPVAPTSVSLNKTSLNLNVGNSETLTATISPSNATDKTLTWTSSNTSVATVSSNGKVTVVAVGNAVITVKTSNGKTASCSITGTPIAAISIALNKSSLTLYDGNSETLSATITPSNVTDKSLTWTSSNTSVATVSNNGKVTAITKGTATITVKTVNGKTASCTVNVIKDPSKAFTWGRDNWSFCNWSSYFGSGTYRSMISDHYIEVLKKNLTNSEYEQVFGGSNSKGYIDKDWGGSCYGMSSLMVLASKGIFPYSSYGSGASSLFNLSMTSNVKSLITYYQLTCLKAEFWTHSNYDYDHEKRINEIISLLDKNSTVLICFNAPKANHAIVAYGYEYGNWTKNGKTYQGRILICDPNYARAYDENAHIYFNKSTYDWEIPGYRYSWGVTSDLDETCIYYVGSDLNVINAGGYLSGGSYSQISGTFVARVDALKIASERSIAKVEKVQNGIYNMKGSGQPHGETDSDIEEQRFSRFIMGEQEGNIGYNLYDADSSYMVSQKNADELELEMDYQFCDMYAYSSAGTSAIFDKSGYTSVNGNSAEFRIGMVSDKNYPTKWFSVCVSGKNSANASLLKTDEGYIITADNLKGVLVKVNNKEESLSRTLTTTYPSALIYQKASGGIGFKVDTDNNGTYETALNADDMPTISKQPANCTCNENEAATFSVTAKGTGLTYLWQYMNAGDTSWTSWTSKTTASISVAYSAARDRMKVRCIITDVDGKQVKSNTATLNYNIPVSITTQPSSVTVNEGKSADFVVVAKGKGLKYLWQYKEAGKTAWTDWTSKTTASINVAYAANRDGMSLRCVVTDASGKKVTSNVATLTYNYPLSITKQPASVTVTANSAASFSVTATGKGLKYLWQYKEAGKSSWTDWTSKTTASISV